MKNAIWKRKALVAWVLLGLFPAGFAAGEQPAHLVTMDCKYGVPGFTYTGKAASVEVWPTQNLAQWWGPRMMTEDGANGVRHFTFNTILRDKYAKFLAFDADHKPLPISGDEIKLDTCDIAFMKKLGAETWDEKLRRLAWWRHDRFGMFIHFGLYSLAARHEWFKSRERVSEADYQRYFDNFNPAGFDARAWARAAKKAGMKYAVLTTKHHEGFCLFDSKYTDYKSTNTKFGRDIVREYAEAFRAEGLKVGFYYSVIDWHHPDYTLDYTHPGRMSDKWDVRCMTREAVDEFNRGRDMNRYREYLRNQVTELLTNYGKIDIVWFDFTPGGARYGEGKTRDDWDAAGLVRLARTLQPGIIIDNRLNLTDYEDGQDFLTPEQCRSEEPPTLAGRQWPWETCQTFSGSWGYYRDEKTWKSGFQILEQLVQTVSCNGNLIMNVGPTGRGEFDARARERLADYAAWMDRCGESIYGCGQAPAEFREQRIPNTLYTYNAERNVLYVHFLCWTTGPIPVPFADRVKYSEFLHDRSEVPFDSVGRLLIPLDKPEVEIPVIALTLKGDPGASLPGERLAKPLRKGYWREEAGIRKYIVGRDVAAGEAEAKAAYDRPVGGRIWRIAPSMTLDEVNELAVHPGDKVLFERGGVWRGQLQPRSGKPGHPIVYGACGEGAKPSIQPSYARNDAAMWRQVEVDGHGQGVWTTETGAAADIGNVIFDDGRKGCAFKKGKLAELKDDLDFWCDPRTFAVHLKSAANPAERFKSIELCEKMHCIEEAKMHDVVYDGLALRYTAAHGIGGDGVKRITVRNCEISWIGGGYLYCDKKGNGVRYGNGIEFWANCEDVLVESNRVWECWDAGLTNQSNEDGAVQRNVVWRGNEVWNCEYSYEYWQQGDRARTENVVVEGNRFRDAGKGWGHRQRWNPNAAHLMFYDTTAGTKGFVVRNNVFSRSENTLFRLFNDWRGSMTFANNRWIAEKESLCRFHGRPTAKLVYRYPDRLDQMHDDNLAEIESQTVTPPRVFGADRMRSFKEFINE